MALAAERQRRLFVSRNTMKYINLRLVLPPALQ